MSFEGVIINKLNGGLNRTNPNTDGVCALVVPVAEDDLPEAAVHYGAIKLLQPSDAAGAGFNEAFDANNGVLIYQQVTEFFRLSPDGVLYLIPIPKPLALAALIAAAAFKECIRQLTEVKLIGIADLAETAADIADDVEDVQAMIDSFAAEKCYVDGIILAAAGAEDATAVNAYADLRVKSAANVSVSIAQDVNVAGSNAAYAKYADVASILGMLSQRQVNENLGSVNIISKPRAKKGNADYPLTENHNWTEAALSDGTLVSKLSGADKKSLTAKGYIFAGSYEGYGGIFFNSSPTCVELASDYCYIENNRVWNKAARLIRAALMPEIKGVVKKDPTTGYIRSTTISRWTGIANAALESMQVADEISGYDIYIDPKQLLSESVPLLIKAQVVKDDIVHEMEVDLGLTNSIA